MKNIISLCLWIVGGTFFLISFSILFISFWTLTRKKTFGLAKSLFGIQIRLMGIRLKISEKEDIDPEQTYLIMGNHQSLFDIFVLPAAIPLVFTGVEASYHFSIPVWGYLIKKWGCIPIERGNLEQAQKTLSEGLSIAILPEGHRTRTGKLGPFKKGPFHLAKKTQATILPFGISGLYEFQSRGGFLLKPGRVNLRIGRPLGYNRYKHLSTDELKEMIFDQINWLSR